VSVSTDPALTVSAEAPEAPRRNELPWPWGVFGAAAVASAALIMYEGRGLLFFFDEWSWIFDRRHLSMDALLQGHAGHLSILPVLVYDSFLWVFGLTHYTAFRGLLLGLHLTCATLVFVYMRRRVRPVAALVPAVVLLFFGAAWQDLLWAFQIGFLMSVAAGLGALLLLDSEHRRANVGVMICVAIALGSSSVGIPIVIGLGVELALRRAWSRVWMIAVPGALYALWYVFYGGGYETSQAWWRALRTHPPGPVARVQFVGEAAGAVVGSLTGVGSVAGQWLLLIVVPVVAVVIWRAGPARRPRLLMLATIPVVFWVLLAQTRAGFQPASESRYLYPGAVFALLLAAECARGVRVPVWATAAIVVVGVAALVWNLDQFRDGRAYLLNPPAAEGAIDMRANLGGIEIGARGVEAGYAAVRPPAAKDVRQYLSAFDDLGFPGSTVDELRAASPALQVRADAYIVHAAGLRLTAPTPAAGPAPAVNQGPAGQPDGPSCLLLGSGGPSTTEVRPRGAAIRIDALSGPVEVRLRNLAPTYYTGESPWASMQAGQAQDLPLPRVTAGPWHVGLSASGLYRVCGVAGFGISRA
jgi:hypothetical protein